MTRQAICPAEQINQINFKAMKAIFLTTGKAILKAVFLALFIIAVSGTISAIYKVAQTILNYFAQ